MDHDDALADVRPPVEDVDPTEEPDHWGFAPPVDTPLSQRPDPRIFPRSTAMRDARPRLHAAIAEGSFLAVQEANGRGASETEVAAVMAGYARAWAEIDAFLTARIDAGTL
jgi:hypothetical protein